MFSVFRRPRIIAAMVFALALGSASAVSATDIRPQQSHPTPTAAEAVQLWEQLSGTRSGAQLYDAACCKICKKGKACGDSCISRSYTCHKGPGCACDG
nr:hypothetical protein [uncultured Celeribacter sp.]